MVNVIIILRTNTHTHIDINQLKWTCEMIHNMCEIWISIRFIGNDDDDDDVYPSIYSSILLLMFCLHSGWMSMLFFFSSFPWFGFQIRQFVYVWYVCVWQKSKLKKNEKKIITHLYWQSLDKPNNKPIEICKHTHIQTQIFSTSQKKYMSCPCKYIHI